MMLAAALVAAAPGDPAEAPRIAAQGAAAAFDPAKTLQDDGWREKVYNRPVRWEVVDDKGPVLHGLSDGTASMLYRPLPCDPNVSPRIRWRWKVVRLPNKTGAGGRAENDYGARIYLVFPGRTFLTSYVLQYVWDNAAPVGTVLRSPTSSRSRHVVAASGTADLGRWIEIERNLKEDFTRAFGWAPDRRIGGIGFMTDSDNTRSSAEAYYGPVTIGK